MASWGKWPASRSTGSRARSSFVARKIRKLRKMEYDLLLLFLENPNKAFSREEILNKVWGYESFPNTTLHRGHAYPTASPQKFDEALFETVRGIGYRLKAS